MAANVVANYATAGTKFGVRVTDSYYQTDANPDPSGNTINGNLLVTGNTTINGDLVLNGSVTTDLYIGAGNNLTVDTGYVLADNVNGSTQLQGGDGVSKDVLNLTLPMGTLEVVEDVNTNNGIILTNQYNATPAVGTTYLSLQTVGGPATSYTNLDHDKNATNAVSSLYLFDVSAVAAKIEMNTNSAGSGNNGIILDAKRVELGNTDVGSSVLVRGPTGLGQVYDTINNPPYQTYGSSFIASGANSQAVSIPGMTTTATVLICAQTTTPMSQGVLSVSNTVNGQFSVFNIDPATGAALNATQNYYFSYLVLPNA